MSHSLGFDPDYRQTIMVGGNETVAYAYESRNNASWAAWDINGSSIYLLVTGTYQTS